VEYHHTMSLTLPQPMAFPAEIFSEIIKMAVIMLGGQAGLCGKRLPLNIMLTNHHFLNMARPLFYRSTALPDAEIASLFFKTLRKCEATNSDYGPRVRLIIHLRFAYEPGSHNSRDGELITRMSQLQSITTDFRDDSGKYPIRNFAVLVQDPPGSLRTIRFISINVDKTKVSLASLGLAVTLNPAIGSGPRHRVGSTNRSGTYSQV
jgi:hypothetical protein